MKPRNDYYDQNALIDFLRGKLDCGTDAALAEKLLQTAPTISNIRANRLKIGTAILLRMHEAAGMSLKDLRMEMGDYRERF